MKRRPNVFDVGPTLHKCYANVFCLLGKLAHTTHISLFRILKAEILSCEGQRGDVVVCLVWHRSAYLRLLHRSTMMNEVSPVNYYSQITPAFINDSFDENNRQQTIDMGYTKCRPTRQYAPVVTSSNLWNTTHHLDLG